MNRFKERLSAFDGTLRRGALEVLQVNLGRKCNLACRHCHVAAAPWRTEMLDEVTARRIVQWIEQHRPATVDLTGGAPELSEWFRYLIEAARRLGCHVIDRNNLTIIEEPDYSWLPGYLARHEVEVIASLPCYSPGNVDAQRGNGVFDKSISALRKLNASGYGTRLPLNLIYNPVGPSLPGPQEELEQDYKAALSERFGIVFNRLYTITNQPIARFAGDLRRQGRWDEYMDLLASAFNPHTVSGLMCRTTLSVGYRGEIYDCDFNQMLGLQLRNGKPLSLWDITPQELLDLDIQTASHCLACTAGAGSSCTGALRGTQAGTLEMRGEPAAGRT